MMNLFYLLPLLGLVILPISSSAEEINQSMEGSMNIKITYPEEVAVGRTFSVSVLVVNNGWEDKQDISFVFSSQDGSILPVNSKEIIIDRLAQGGSFGSSLDFKIEDVLSGIHFLNIKYSQVLIANNETPLQPISQDITIPIKVINEPDVNIYTKTPESIFTNAEFPFEVEVTSDDINIRDVTIKVVTPKGIDFRGETMHTFSKIEKGNPVSFTSRIVTPTEEVNTEYKLPFEVIVEYTDDLEEEKTEAKTVSLVLRPRTFMELTTDGGIWVGDFFIAPYVSLGTIIGIPTGTILSVLIRRRMDKPKKRKRKKKL